MWSMENAIVKGARGSLVLSKHWISSIIFEESSYMPPLGYKK